MKELGYAREYSESSPQIGALFDLSGRVAMITGGASGLGRAIGLGFARFGADVAVVDISRGRAEAVADEVRAVGRRARPFMVDVTSYEDVERTVDEVQAELGPIDILVNSAGSNIRKPVLEMTPEEWQLVVALNLGGTFNCAKAVGKGMVARRRGKVINLASILGHVVLEGQGAYSPSKGGVVQLTKVLAVEWAPHNVQVNCISPTYIKTPLTQAVRDDEERYGRLNLRSPIHRFGEPWELIGPAVFLASDASGLVSGHALVVDGGWIAT
jgi:NAD(P)-dependent dehydrogenase (short-subunit alcohol dehydrogenase family)